MSVEKDLLNPNISSRVYYLLGKFNNLRDDDKKLWFAYCEQFLNLQATLKTAEPQLFYNWLMKSEVPTFESISRCRRKIQEKHPHLRGDGWIEKHNSSNRIRESISKSVLP